MLYAQDLKGLTCQAPGCKHLDHDKGIFIHSKCHLGWGVKCHVGYAHDPAQSVLSTLCAGCQKQIAQFAIRNSCAGKIECKNHGDQSLEVYFDGEQPKLTITCNMCHEFIKTIHLQER